MAQPIIWTEPAWRDLEQIIEYIAKDAPVYAAAFVRRVHEAASTLGALPRRGRVVPELGDVAVRELILGNYRLIYELRDDALYLLGVVHGARDLAALWGRERRSPP